MEIPTPDFLPEDPKDLETSDLNEHEVRVVRCALAGKTCSFGQTRPEPDGETAPTIRADLIRFLARGGNSAYPVDPKGVTIWGARIEGELDLEACTGLRRLGLDFCHLTDVPLMRDASGQLLSLQHSHLPGLRADRLTLSGNLFLRGTEASGPVRLLGAKIGGDLDCKHARFGGKGTDGRAFSMGGAEVTGHFFCRELAGPPVAMVDLASARVGTLADDAGSWPGQNKGGLILDGFRYDRIIGPTDFETRRDWLLKQVPRHLKEEFKPQPLEQLAKVLRETGHTEDAKRIQIEKHRLQRAANWTNNRWRPRQVLRHMFSYLFEWVAGFGYRPANAVFFMFGFWVVGYAVFSVADRVGVMIPADSRVTLSDAWHKCREAWADDKAQLRCWQDSADSDYGRGRDYPPFSPAAYAIDTFVPLVDLDQEDRWIPAKQRGLMGWFARLYLWLHIAFGWIVTALFAASVTGLVKREG